MTIGKRAAITGACGIGFGIARAFANARRNWRLVDTDKVARMRHAKSSAEGRQRKTFNLDVRNREGYARVADKAEAQLCPVSTNHGAIVRKAGLSFAFSSTDFES